jgi:hypothetical protein
MPAPVLQFKRGNAGVAGTVPALRPGEPAISLNNFDFFIGIDTSVANNKFFGSHRYWGREDGTTSLRLKLVDKDGTNGIHLKSPNTVSGITTYTLPETPINSYILTTNSAGVLSWTNAIPGGTLTGITTFTDATDNTLGNADTGAVQIDGGLGINKNVTVGGNLNVQGYSNFVGVVTFQGGTINIGDSNTDNINVSGEFISNLTPNADNTYDIGISTQRWRDAKFAGIGSFATGVYADGIRLGISATNEIDTTSGNLVLRPASGRVVVDNHLDVNGDINATGNISLGGTTIILRGTDVYIENKDIILGYSTTTSPNDDTANHAGVAIASTEGSPLVSFTASGINTLPDTYKQMMWFQSGTLGFATDMFAFNYGVAIGTTTVANGVRLAVGSGVTVTDTVVSAPIGNFGTLSGSLSGTISTATRALRVDTTTAPNGTFYPGLFVNSTGTASTAVYVDAGISYVSNTDTLTLTGDIAINGGDVTTSATTFNLVNGTATSVNFAGAATNLVMGASSGITTVANNLTVGGDIRVNGNDIQASDGNTNITLTSNTLTTFAGDIRVNGNDIQASDGNSNITLTSNTLTTFAGDIKVTGNDIQSSTATALTLSGADVTVAGDITVGGNDIKASNGTTALTLATTGAVTAANDLTVSGNLYVNGSTTQVNTASLTVEDRTIELGLVDGSAPGSATTWDLGVLFNYNSSGAKKSGVIWEHADGRFKFGSQVADGGGTDNNSPQITFTAYAPIEIGALWVNDCAGQSQVISCTGTERFLENITVDCGSF